MRKTMMCFVVSFLFAGFIAGPASAKESGVGIGVIFGQPTGLSVKVWLANKNAIDLAAGYSLRDDDFHLHFHADYLYHTDPIGKSNVVKIPLYFGVGGDLRLDEDDQHEDENWIGVRIPVGLDFIFRKAPLDIFIEVAPIMELVPETEFDFDAGIGIRLFLG